MCIWFWDILHYFFFNFLHFFKLVLNDSDPFLSVVSAFVHKHFQMACPLKLESQSCSNFIWSLLRLRQQKIATIVAVHWPRWSLCQYMVKTFQNLFLQNWGCLGAESLHKSSWTGGLPNLLKWWSYTDIWLFYGVVKFASLGICRGPIHLYG